MPIPFIAMAGASLLGSGISAFGAARQNSQNLRAQQARQRMIDGAASQNQAQISQLFGGLQNTLGALGPVQGQQAQTNAFSFDPLQASQASVQGFNPATAGMPDQIAGQSLDLDAIFGGSGSQAFNMGQDGLMQFLRADPAGKMQGTNGVLQEIAATGLPSDLSSIFAQATNVNRDNNAELLAMATGTGAGLGQRFGSATQRIAGDTARRLGNEQSLQNSQLALQAGEAAAGRRLNAASQLGQFQLQGSGQLLDAGQRSQQLMLQAALANQQNAFQTGSFNANLRQQGAQFDAAAMNNAGQFNAAAANQMGQFNAGALNTAAQNNIAFGLQANQNNNQFGLQATRQNNDQQLNERQALLAQLGLSGQLAGQQSNALNQILGIRAGQGAPQASGQNVAQSIGGGFQDLATIMQLFNRFGGGNQPSVVDPAIQPMSPIRTRR